MSEFEVTSYTSSPWRATIRSPSRSTPPTGNKWEYGVPFSRDTGRKTFEEMDVLANDFGEDFAEEASRRSSTR